MGIVKHLVVLGDDGSTSNEKSNKVACKDADEPKVGGIVCLTLKGKLYTGEIESIHSKYEVLLLLKHQLY